MKRFTLGLFLFACIALQQASAQNFDGKNIDLGVGIGVGSPYTTGFAVPVFAQIDFGVADKISVGGFLGFAASNDDGFGYESKYSYIFFGGRGNYHWGKHIDAIPEKFDLYAGLTLAFTTFNYKYELLGDDYKVSDTDLWFGAHVGGRYFFKDNLAGFAEVGYGISSLRIGVNFRLK